MNLDILATRSSKKYAFGVSFLENKNLKNLNSTHKTVKKQGTK